MHSLCLRHLKIQGLIGNSGQFCCLKSTIRFWNKYFLWEISLRQVEVVCSTDLTCLVCLIFCSLMLAVVRSAGQVLRVEPCGATVEPCGATVEPHGSTCIILMYLFLFIYCTSDRWRHVAPQWRHRAPQGCHPITWPADLTTANRSEHNIKQNKLVRSVEQTT